MVLGLPVVGAADLDSRAADRQGGDADAGRLEGLEGERRIGTPVRESRRRR